MSRHVPRLGMYAATLLIALIFGFLAALPANAAGLHHAGLVVRHSNGTVVARTIAFGEDSITGLDLLERSGLSVLVDTNSSMGSAVANIDGEGCNYPKESAFCKCSGRPCIFWNYFHEHNNAWVFSNLGASNALIKDGDVDAWGWGDGSVGSQIPVIPFSHFYSPPTPIPPTATRVPPTATPRPPTPSPTPRPTALLAAPPTATHTIEITPTAATEPALTPTAQPIATATGAPATGAAPTTTVAQTSEPATVPTTIVATTAPVVANLPDTAIPTAPPILPQPAPANATVASDTQPPVAAYALFGAVVLGLGGLWFWNTRRH